MSNQDTDVNHEVSFVIDTRNNSRVSQYYIRKGDAIRKAKQINGWYKGFSYKAVTGQVTNLRDSVES